jgi:hypothetical protein
VESVHCYDGQCVRTPGVYRLEAFTACKANSFVSQAHTNPLEKSMMNQRDRGLLFSSVRELQQYTQKLKRCSSFPIVSHFHSTNLLYATTVLIHPSRGFPRDLRVITLTPLPHLPRCLPPYSQRHPSNSRRPRGNLTIPPRGRVHRTIPWS